MADKGQSKAHSWYESILTTGCGIIVAMTITQIVTDIPLITNITLTSILTVCSISQKQFWRRVFNRITVNRGK